MDHLDKLVATLRDELQQYGQMLFLLDQQQEHVMRRAALDVLNSVAEIEAQGGVIQRVREQRTRLQSDVCARLGLARTGMLFDLVKAMPENYGLLIQALVEENNALLVRVQQRVRQNHLLLSRSLELMQRFLGTLFPTQEQTRYTDRGALFQRFHSPTSLYEAVG